MPPSINSMVPEPHRAPATANEPSVVPALKAGGSKEAGPAATPIMDSENTAATAKGDVFSQGLAADARPVLTATPSQPGSGGNVASDGPAGRFPAAGSGSGTGRPSRPAPPPPSKATRPTRNPGGFPLGK